jgi:hypothetical protein
MLFLLRAGIHICARRTNFLEKTQFFTTSWIFRSMAQVSLLARVHLLLRAIRLNPLDLVFFIEQVGTRSLRVGFKSREDNNLITARNIITACSERHRAAELDRPRLRFLGEQPIVCVRFTAENMVLKRKTLTVCLVLLSHPAGRAKSPNQLSWFNLYEISSEWLFSGRCVWTSSLSVILGER